MKFTTLIPESRNDGTEIEAHILSRLIDRLWRPFRGMTEEGRVIGHWIDDDGIEFTDVCIKVSIECDRGGLQEAIRAVRRLGLKLEQKAMYFEVTGSDGVQILHIEYPNKP
jgi:hypothetical protein